MSALRGKTIVDIQNGLMKWCIGKCVTYYCDSSCHLWLQLKYPCHPDIHTFDRPRLLGNRNDCTVRCWCYTQWLLRQKMNPCQPKQHIINRSIDRSINQSFIQLISQSVSQSVSKSVSQSASQSVSQSVNLLFQLIFSNTYT